MINEVVGIPPSPQVKIPYPITTMITNLNNCLEALQVKVIITPAMEVHGAFNKRFWSIGLQEYDVAVLGHEALHVAQTILANGKTIGLPKRCAEYVSAVKPLVAELYCPADRAVEAEAIAWELWYDSEPQEAMAWLLYQLNKAVYVAA